MAAAHDFQPLRIVESLQRHGVDYIVIGGIAGTLHGSDAVTNDFDICYRRSQANHRELVGALKDLQAVLRGAPPGLPFNLDERTLKNGDSFTFETIAGNFDCLATPTGTTGYADLIRDAETMDVDGTPVRVASLRDLIRMKRRPVARGTCTQWRLSRCSAASSHSARGRG